MGSGLAINVQGHLAECRFHASLAAFRRQFQPDLASTGQFNVNLAQQFGIEQRAMLGAVRTVDAIAGAQRVE